MQIGSLVNWIKPEPGSESDALTLPAIVNGVWEDGSCSLFVFHFDGQFLARIVPVDQLELIASPSNLEKLPEILQRLSDLEAAFQLLAGPGPVSVSAPVPTSKLEPIYRTESSNGDPILESKPKHHR